MNQSKIKKAILKNLKLKTKTRVHKTKTPSRKKHATTLWGM